MFVCYDISNMIKTIKINKIDNNKIWNFRYNIQVFLRNKKYNAVNDFQKPILTRHNLHVTKIK